MERFYYPTLSTVPSSSHACLGLRKERAAHVNYTEMAAWKENKNLQTQLQQVKEKYVEGCQG